jgi:ring-1,2-phenylacetyl-CoA epoxidase subunit PaaC
VEQPNGNYADTLVRQFLFDAGTTSCSKAWRSSDARIAEIAQKSLKEVTYHVRRTDLMMRLGDGTRKATPHAGRHRRPVDVHRRTVRADALDEAMVPPGAPIAANCAALAGACGRGACAKPRCRCRRRLWMQSGGKQGRHTEHLGYLLAEMQFLQRAYPGAKW